MAQGDQFQFAIAYPLKNHKFRHPTLLTYSVTINTANAIAVTEDYADAKYKIGCGVVPGEFDSATIITSDGLTSQNITIVAVLNLGGSASSLICKETLTSGAYNGGTIEIKGTGIAGGWSVPTAGIGSGQKTPKTTIPPGGGKNDRYAQYLTLTNSGSTPITGGILQTLDPAKMQDCTMYRIGLDYKYNTNTYAAGLNTSFSVRLEDSLTSALPLNKIIATEFDALLTEWNSSNAAFLWNPLSSVSDLKLISPTLKLVLGCSQSNIVRVWLDNIYLEHAFKIEEPDTVMAASTAGGIWTVTLNRQASELGWVATDEVIVSSYLGGSTGRLYLHSNRFLVKSASGRSLVLLPIGTTNSDIMVENAIIHKNTGGYYQPNDWPLRSSINYERSPMPQRTALASGDVRSWYAAADGDRSERWMFSCQYVNVAQSIYDAFQNIIRWQERGELVAFHPNIDDLPSVMIGQLAVSGYTKGQHTWDFSTCSFNLDFTEVLT